MATSLARLRSGHAFLLCSRMRNTSETSLCIMTTFSRPTGLLIVLFACSLCISDFPQHITASCLMAVALAAVVSVVSSLDSISALNSQFRVAGIASGFDNSSCISIEFLPYFHSNLNVTLLTIRKCWPCPILLDSFSVTEPPIGTTEMSVRILTSWPSLKCMVSPTFRLCPPLGLSWS